MFSVTKYAGHATEVVRSLDLNQIDIIAAVRGNDIVVMSCA